MTIELTCETITALTEGDQLWNDWQGLLDRVRPELRLFGPAWYSLWSETAGSCGRWTGQLRVVTARDERHALRGVLALGRGKVGPFTAYSLAGDAQPWRTIVADAEHEADVARVFGKYLARPGGSLLRLGPCRQTAQSTKDLVEAIQDSGAFIQLHHRVPLAVCDAPDTWEDFRNDVLGSKFFRKINYYERRTGRDGEMKIEHIRQPSPEQTRRMIDDLGEIERRSWLADAENGRMRFATDAGRALWAGLIDQVLSPYDQVDCWVMSLDGRPVSFCFTLTILPVRYVLANNYDETVKSHRTGSTLYRHMMEDGIHRGVRRFDFGSGELHYKSLWGATYQGSLDSYVVVPNGLVGKLAKAAWAVKQRIRPTRYSESHSEAPEPQVKEEPIPSPTETGNVTPQPSQEVAREPVPVG